MSSHVSPAHGPETKRRKLTSGGVPLSPDGYLAHELSEDLDDPGHLLVVSQDATPSTTYTVSYSVADGNGHVFFAGSEKVTAPPPK
ncbi:MAG: hypothetical protein QOF83_1317 [Solirubrobacteraceae bacterium]|nr:hypothetical protein [Solirubrobacteraceae bacterium]